MRRRTRECRLVGLSILCLLGVVGVAGGSLGAASAAASVSWSCDPFGGLESNMAPGFGPSPVFADGATVADISGPGCVTQGAPGPHAVAAGPDGNAWGFAFEGGASAIERVTPTLQGTYFSNGLDPGSDPFAFTSGPDGNMWFTDRGADGTAIGRVTPDGVITEFSSGLGLNRVPKDITAGPDGNVWFTTYGIAAGQGGIGRITPDGDITVFNTDIANTYPSGLVVGPDGNLWFGDNGGSPGGTDAIGRITPDGQITLFSDGLQQTHTIDIIVGPDGALWASQEDYGLARITTDGEITEYPLGGFGASSNPEYLTTSPNGIVYSYEYVNGAFIDTGYQLWGFTGTGMSPASVSPPTVTGSPDPGAQLTCEPGQWTSWFDGQPSDSALSVDGFAWFRDGLQIATGSTYTPTASDLGHQLECAQTVTYTLPSVTASAASTGVTIGDTTDPTNPSGSNGPTSSGGPTGPAGGNAPTGASGTPAPAGNPAPAPTTLTHPTAVHTRTVQPDLIGRLTASINAHAAKATFTFRPDGKAQRLQCALVRPGHGSQLPAPRYANCGTTKTYTHLARHRTYVFYVRAVTPNGRTSKPKTHRFQLK